MPAIILTADGFGQLLLLSPVWGLIGFGLSSIDAYIIDGTPKKSRGSAIGTSHMIFGLSVIAGPALGGLLYQQVSPASPFIASAILGVVSVALGLRLLR